MTKSAQNIEEVLNSLFKDAKNDHFRAAKSMAKAIFRPIAPKDFKDVYLSISREQGEDLRRFIEEKNIKHIVEFGTSFGISTLYLAQGALATGGNVVTTELIPSKADQAIENFKLAGVSNLIEVRVGDAMETLKDYSTPIDLLFLDGWKDLYLPLFQMLEPNFHEDTFIYVDNADMADAHTFLQTVGHSERYDIRYIFKGKAALISSKKN